MAFTGMNMAANAKTESIQGSYLKWDRRTVSRRLLLAFAGRGQRTRLPTTSAAGSWNCSCGAVEPPESSVPGAESPDLRRRLVCSCGAVNKGRFCSECGKPKPAGSPASCDKCGWEPEKRSGPSS